MIHVCFYDVSNTIIWSGRHQILSESSAVPPSVLPLVAGGSLCIALPLPAPLLPVQNYKNAFIWRETSTHVKSAWVYFKWTGRVNSNFQIFFYSNGNMRGKRCFQGTIKDASNICKKLLIIVIYFSPGWSIGLTRSDSSFGISANMSPDGRPCRRWVPARKKKMSLRTIHDWLIRVHVSHRVSNLQRWRCGKGRSCWTKLLKKSKKWWCLKSAQSG